MLPEWLRIPGIRTHCAQAVAGWRAHLQPPSLCHGAQAALPSPLACVWSRRWGPTTKAMPTQQPISSRGSECSALMRGRFMRQLFARLDSALSPGQALSRRRVHGWARGLSNSCNQPPSPPLPSSSACRCKRCSADNTTCTKCVGSCLQGNTSCVGGVLLEPACRLAMAPHNGAAACHLALCPAQVLVRLLPWQQWGLHRVVSVRACCSAAACRAHVVGPHCSICLRVCVCDCVAAAPRIPSNSGCTAARPHSRWDLSGQSRTRMPPLRRNPASLCPAPRPAAPTPCAATATQPTLASA